MPAIRYNDQGLIPAIVQDVTTRQVLMLAWMNEDSFNLTMKTGETHFWSRSRGELWHKGETSGNTQKVETISLDCDGDTLLVSVRPAGPACHTGKTTCFHHSIKQEKE